MSIKLTMGRVEAGTRYSNSETYDEATDEVVYGWQVYVQKRKDGTRTGRRSFVNNSGILCGIELAEDERRRAERYVAEQMAKMLHRFEGGRAVGEHELAGLLNSAMGIRV